MDAKSRALAASGYPDALNFEKAVFQRRICGDDGSQQLPAKYSVDV